MTRSKSGWCFFRNASSSSPIQRPRRKKNRPVNNSSNANAGDGLPEHYVGIAVATGRTLTFAHVRAASHLAAVLRPGGIYSAAQLEEAGLVPFRGIGDDLVEEVVKALRL